MSLFNLTVEQRFFKLVEVIPFHSCWEWRGNKNPAGYGRIDIRKKSYRAHRLSWELHNGEIPDGLVVCHKCDNPGCVRPDHLFLGTDADNTRDRNAKGRSNMPKGEEHFKSKLTTSQVRRIRSSKETSRNLASIYGVSHHNIFCIKRRKTWKSV